MIQDTATRADSPAESPPAAAMTVQPLEPDPGAAAESTLRVSVVIPTLGRPRLLRRCLSALVRQTLPPDSFEIIVVDDGRSQTTRDIVAAYAGRSGAPRLVVIEPAPGAHGPAAARNAGWRAAQAPVIAFTDDDTVPALNWLAQALNHFPDWASAISGRVRVPLPDAPTDWQRTTAGLDGAEFVTANCLVRRAALDVVGGFDERYERPWREDSDLYFALLEHGYRVVAAPSALVLHPARPAPWGVSLRQQRNMLFDALLYKKHRELYRAKIAALPPLRYYAAVGLLVTSLLCASFGAWGYAAVALAGWLLWTLWFTAVRLHGARHTLRDALEMLVTSAAIPVLAVFWRLAGAVRYRVWFA